MALELRLDVARVERDRHDAVALELLRPVLRDNDISELALAVQAHAAGTVVAAERLVLEVDSALGRKHVRAGGRGDDADGSRGRHGGGRDEDGKECLRERVVAEDLYRYTSVVSVRP